MKLRLILLLVVGLLLLLVQPAPAYLGDDHDTWPCFYGVDNAGPDEGWMVFYDQGDSAWDAPRMIDDDLLDGQWTPQRNAISWTTGGKWGVAFIEDTGNDLEYWESPDDFWQDEGAAWAMLDDDAAVNYLAVDIATRQNYVYAVTLDAADYHSHYIDLTAGVPAWTSFSITSPVSPSNYSFVLDDNLFGAIHQTFVYNLGLAYICLYIDEASSTPIATIGGSRDYPQIIVDGEERLWIFATFDDQLFRYTKANIPQGGTWAGGLTAVYSATTLTADYHATWLKMDDTIHVALVDENLVGNSLLIYLRRTPNGWSAPVTLLTVDSINFGDDDGLSWPQITVDPFGAIFIYYIRSDAVSVTDAGDLQGFYLDSSLYAIENFAVPANWVQHVDIDDSEDLVQWCVAPDSIPINGDM